MVALLKVNRCSCSALGELPKRPTARKITVDARVVRPAMKVKYTDSGSRCDRANGPGRHQVPTEQRGARARVGRIQTVNYAANDRLP